MNFRALSLHSDLFAGLAFGLLGGFGAYVRPKRGNIPSPLEVAADGRLLIEEEPEVTVRGLAFAEDNRAAIYDAVNYPLKAAWPRAHWFFEEPAVTMVIGTAVFVVGFKAVGSMSGWRAAVMYCMMVGCNEYLCDLGNRAVRSLFGRKDFRNYVVTVVQPIEP